MGDVLGVWDEAFSHADDGVDCVAERLVEVAHGLVGGADLEINLGAAGVFEGFFGELHELAGEAFALVGWRDCKVIYPAAVSIVADHAGGDKGIVRDSDCEPLGVHVQLSSYVAVGIVVRDNQLAGFP